MESDVEDPVAVPACVWIATSKDARLSAKQAVSGTGQKRCTRFWNRDSMQLTHKVFEEHCVAFPEQAHHIVGIALLQPLQIYDHTIRLGSHQRQQFHFWQARKGNGNAFADPAASDVDYKVILAKSVQRLQDDEPVVFVKHRRLSSFFTEMEAPYSRQLFVHSLPRLPWARQAPRLVLILPMAFAQLVISGVWQHIILPNNPLIQTFGWQHFRKVWPRGELSFKPAKFRITSNQFQLTMARELADDLRDAFHAIEPHPEALGHWISMLESTSMGLRGDLHVHKGVMRCKLLVDSLLLADGLRSDGDLRVTLKRALQVLFPDSAARTWLAELED